MRKLAIRLYTYTEFFVVAFSLFPVFLITAAVYRDRDPGYRARGRVMRFLGRFTSSITPLWRFSVTGKAPPDVSTPRTGRGYVVVSNHVSMADIYLLSHLPFDMRFLAKEEIFRLPFIGWLLKCSADVPLRRGDSESVREAMEELRRTLDAGVSVMIFPEGTRTRDGNLLPFKDGAFRLAIEAGAPVLPVLLTGTANCLPYKASWLGEARATAALLEPIETSGLTLDDVERLREMTRDRIAEAAGQRSEKKRAA